MYLNLLFYILLLSSFKVYSQEDISGKSAKNISLEGEWSGSYDTPDLPNTEFSVALYFRLSKDSTYQIFSYSKGEDTVVVCEVHYRFISEDSLNLEEVKQILPIRNISNGCFQKMFLKIESTSKETKMSGIWKNIDPSCRMTSGNITFRKRKKNGV